MQGLYFLYPALIIGASIIQGAKAAQRSATNSVLLSNVKTLTLRNGLKTSHRRVPPIPQVSVVWLLLRNHQTHPLLTRTSIPEHLTDQPTFLVARM